MREGWKAEKAVHIFGNIHLAGQLRSSWLATWGGRSLCHGACLWLAGWTFIVPDNAFLHFSEHLASSGGRVMPPIALQPSPPCGVHGPAALRSEVKQGTQPAVSTTAQDQRIETGHGGVPVLASPEERGSMNSSPVVSPTAHSFAHVMGHKRSWPCRAWQRTV